MDETEEVLVELFRRLREYLVTEYGIGLTLNAEAQAFSLKIRSRKNSGDEQQPYFALVVIPRDGAYRIPWTSPAYLRRSCGCR